MTVTMSTRRRRSSSGWRFALAASLTLALGAGHALAQPVVGSFVAVEGGARLEFTPAQAGRGAVRGTYEDAQVRLAFDGVADEDGAFGWIDGTDLAFEAYVAGDRLLLYVYALDARGEADMGTVQELHFTRVASAPPTTGAPAQLPAALAPAAGSGVDVVAGQEYGAGAPLRIAGLGLTQVVPDGWSGGMQLGQAIMLFGSHSLPGLVLVMPFVGSSVDEVWAQMAQPIDLGDGVTLQATAPTRLDAGVRSPLTGFGPQGRLIGHAVATFGDATGALILVVDAVASGRDEAYYRDTADRFVQGLRFDAPTPTEHDASWRQRLEGTMLRYQSSAGGADRTGSGFVQASATAHLCSDGTFHYAGRSSVSATVPGVSGLGTDATELSGRWQVSGLGPDQALLIAHDTFGGAHLWVVNDVQNQVYVNGEPWARMPSDACR